MCVRVVKCLRSSSENVIESEWSEGDNEEEGGIAINKGRSSD